MTLGLKGMSALLARAKSGTESVDRHSGSNILSRCMVEASAG
jgi:hypothetical protein